ncbi:MAG: glycosyltransferase [Gomphosphaeria aponina SAG 52.96 = DSM 107014]|uniref:Glycosyltransferase n=1 Tax=Gomphosphaeria aponina SAG 52.96 = DSM 107014 TaxID=1521640 RepID=A0A941GVH7_9CHRO|nr:glycosyltransferase [Gomphosphaeria aponina SAG 52.96 = DSM 107014]
MRCPTLKELPPPPEGKTGWPWTEESEQLPDKMPAGSDWPKISIVTPNYNYGKFIEETIRSILLQGYPNLEYIIIDGASTDNSVEIIKKYEPWLSYWVTEKDKGQANAINKGLGKCSGEIFNWINSDDILSQNSLKSIAQEIQNADALGGQVLNFQDNQVQVIPNNNLSSYNFVRDAKNSIFHQPGLWLKTDLVKKIGGLIEDYNYCFDWDLTIKYLYLFPNINYSSIVLAQFRLHDISKTINYAEGFDNERDLVLNNLLKDKKYHKLHHLIKLRNRKKSWNRYISEQLTIQGDKLLRSRDIIFQAFRDPQIRWTRFTMGALKRILTS